VNKSLYNKEKTTYRSVKESKSGETQKTDRISEKHSVSKKMAERDSKMAARGRKQKASLLQ
jgi:hypothetical protein